MRLVYNAAVHAGHLTPAGTIIRPTAILENNPGYPHSPPLSYRKIRTFRTRFTFEPKKFRLFGHLDPLYPLRRARQHGHSRTSRPQVWIYVRIVQPIYPCCRVAAAYNVVIFTRQQGSAINTPTIRQVAPCDVEGAGASRYDGWTAAAPAAFSAILVLSAAVVLADAPPSLPCLHLRPDEDDNETGDGAQGVEHDEPLVQSCGHKDAQPSAVAR